MFHSQFLLNYDQYRDNNNFVRYNTLKFTINRWSLAPAEFVNEYLDMVAYPNWVGERVSMTINCSRDGGSSWKNEELQLLFGIYFFLSDDRVEHYKILANITEVIAIIEGVASLLFMFIKIIPQYINYKQIEAKTIRNCYFDVD